jgi:multidrug efflux pump subunit AcrA (membrane-fusion protein)
MAVEVASGQSQLTFPMRRRRSARLKSNESVVLRPETAGALRRSIFKDGTIVGKGTVLVGLDAADSAGRTAAGKGQSGTGANQSSAQSGTAGQEIPQSAGAR